MSLNPEKYVREALNDLPKIVDVELLSSLTGLSPARIYVRRTEQKRLRKQSQESHDAVKAARAEVLLPLALTIPGSTNLVFTKNAVIDWFVLNQADRAIKPANKGVGRPPGSKSRRGIGRTQAESGTA